MGIKIITDDVVISSRKSAKRLLKSLEMASKKQVKDLSISRDYEEIKTDDLKYYTEKFKKGDIHDKR